MQYIIKAKYNRDCSFNHENGQTDEQTEMENGR